MKDRWVRAKDLIAEFNLPRNNVNVFVHLHRDSHYITKIDNITHINVGYLIRKQKLTYRLLQELQDYASECMVERGAITKLAREVMSSPNITQCEYTLVTFMTDNIFKRNIHENTIINIIWRQQVFRLVRAIRAIKRRNND